MLTIRLLGSATIEGDHGPLTGPATQRHRLALLALLAAAHPGSVGRDKLLAYLWPERDAERARNLLNQAVHALRKALGEETVVTVADELRLEPSVLAVDIIQFERAARAGDIARAIQLYRGDFLDGFFLSESVEFERWLDGERARFRAAYLHGLEELARAAAERGRARERVAWWQRLAAEEPFSSRVALELMNALEASGERADAIRHARIHAHILAEELGAEPDPSVVALAERMRSDPRVVQETTLGPSSQSRMEKQQPAGAAAAPVQGAQAAGMHESAASQTSRESAALPGRHGFRKGVLVAALACLLLGAAGWAILERSARQTPISRLAVLPLANLTGDPEQEYFVAGMHDALLSELGRIRGLTVISRQSVIRYQGSDESLPAIARALNVDAVVEGSVFLAGDSVRVTAQLVHAQPERHLWAGTYHGALADALALQAEVAIAIANAIHGTVLPALTARLANARTLNPAAQQAYLVGLNQVEQFVLGNRAPAAGRAALRMGIAELERAVSLDPQWAAAHAHLAHAYHLFASGMRGAGAEFYPKSKASALRALQLDEMNARAHASLGFVLAAHEHEWARAERAIRRAIELDANAYHGLYGNYLRSVGRDDEAVEHLRLAEERNPASRWIKQQIAGALFCAGRFDEALEQAEHVYRLWPQLGSAPGHGFRGNVYSMRSMHADAIREYDRAAALTDSTAWALAGLAYVHARAGNLDTAVELTTRLEDATSYYDPVLYAALGRTDDAVVMLQAALEEHGVAAVLEQRCFPEFETLRSDLRLRENLRRIGLRL